MDTINPVKCCELDDSKAVGYKKRGRQTDGKTDRQTERKQKRRKNITTKKKGGYNVSARDTFSEKLLKQYSTYY